MKNILKGALILALAVAIYVAFQVFKPQRDVANENAIANVTSKTLLSDFSKNLNQANTKYLNKTIEVTGNVTSSENNLIVIDDVISCVMQPNESKPKIGEKITIKGKLIGYENDILTEIKLSESIIKN